MRTVLLILYLVVFISIARALACYLIGKKNSIKSAVIFTMMLTGLFLIVYLVLSINIPAEYVGRSAVLYGAAVTAMGLIHVLNLCRKYKSEIKTDLKKKTVRGILRIVLVAMLLEATVFNISFFRTLGVEKINNFDIKLSEAFTLQEDGNYLIEGGKSARITISNIQGNVKNIYIDIESASNPVTDIQLGAFDDAGTNVFPKTYVVSRIEDSKYHNLHFAGQAQSITLDILKKDGKQIKINSIELNKTVPYSFSRVRCLLIIVIMTLIYLIRPKSPLYKYHADMKIKWQRYVVISVTGFVLSVMTLLCAVFPTGLVRNSYRDQYSQYARVLAKGQLYFDIDASEEFKSLENPYNSQERKTLDKKYRSMIWDHAYYEGKFYMYFGIVPEILLFLPFYLITGLDLPSCVSVAAGLIAAGIALMKLLYLILRRYFPKTPFLIYLLSGITAIICTQVILIKYPTVYTIPISAGIALAIWGLYFWFSAKGLNGSLKSWRLAAGSLCMALVFGCRPQIGLIVLTAIPLFWSETVHDRTLFSKRGAKATACMMVPFVVVAAGLMWYNYIRFDSPFDFGANYNITTNDMTKRGFRLSRIPYAIYAFFLQLPKIEPNFPILTAVDLNTKYQGLTIAESLFGGVLTCFPLLLANIFIFKAKSILKKKKLWVFSVMLIIISVVIAIADVNMAGLLLRYQNDFSFMLFVSAFIVLLGIWKSIKTDEGRQWFGLFFSTAIIFTASYGILLYFANETASISLRSSLPGLYYYMANLFSI